ncbi:MAG: alcohol dehydrogenase catalytic domain-containing protein [Armatimonadetes bacterium]|nr:alcohol dehydrogenase catalytic domain-containing protein [Armatimonadota bacterium]MDE2207654.1 alcohol dehydrogenase catalytic domain-containing protein [Armatimonadota bacterium]
MTSAAGDTIRAAVLYGAADVRIEQVLLPPPASGEVQVRIAAALTCGTDVKVYRRGYHARMLQPPCRFGHEFAGEICAVGPDVGFWTVGDRVVAANSAPCGQCAWCRALRESLCDDLLFLNGAYAERINVPARIVRRNLVRAGPEVSLETLAMAEPLACVMHGLRRMRMAAGDLVAVLGCGPIGLMFVERCTAAGARVIALGRRAGRLAAAERMGAAAVIDIDSVHDAVAAVAYAAGRSAAVPVVVEAVGSPEAWELASRLIARGGELHLFGGCPTGAQFTVPAERLHYEELTIRGSFHHTPASFGEAAELLSSPSPTLASLVEARIGLDDLPAWMEAAAAGSVDAVKTAVLPQAC